MGGVFFFLFFFVNWYECGSEDKDFIYFRTCIELKQHECQIEYLTAVY